MAGTFRKRGNSYYLEYMCNGERYSQSVKASSDSDAKKQLALFVAEIEKNNYKSNDLTFTELAQMFIDKHAKNNLSPTTVMTYKYQLNKHILSSIGGIKINKLKRLHIQDLANKLLEEDNLSTKTIKNDLKLISAILEKGIEWDLVNVNIAHKVTAPINRNKPKKNNKYTIMRKLSYYSKH